jgi:hypothetical protein
MLVNQSVLETISLFHYPVRQKKNKGVFLQLVYQNSWHVICYCIQLILGNVSILKSVLLPLAGSFTVTAWICNASIYTGHPK